MNRLQKGFLALAGAALLAQNANADTNTYTAGDLLLGIRLADGSGQNYEVNLGNFALYSSGGPAFTLSGVSVADISGQYGAGWNNGTASLLWAVGGFDTLSPRDIFTTRMRVDPLIQSVPWNNESTATANAVFTQINSMGGGAGGFAGRISTANSATATFVDASLANSYNKRVGAAANWTGTFQGNVENNMNMTAFGSVVSDLYKVLPTGAASGAASYLGYFTFTANGATFTPVPEPATLTFVGAGLTALFLRQQFRRKQA